MYIAYRSHFKHCLLVMQFSRASLASSTLGWKKMPLAVLRLPFGSAHKNCEQQAGASSLPSDGPTNAGRRRRGAQAASDHVRKWRPTPAWLTEPACPARARRSASDSNFQIRNALAENTTLSAILPLPQVRGPAIFPPILLAGLNLPNPYLSFHSFCCC